MRRSYLLALFFIVITLITPSSYAVLLDNLYSVELQVKDQSSTERQELFLQAFKQVLFKLTGDHKAFVIMQAKPANNPIDKYISSFSYIEEISGTLRLKIIFNETIINDWLKESNITYLDKNRPIVFVWLLEDKNNGFKLIEEDDQELMISKLEQLAAEQSIPLVLPLLDLDERTNVQVDDILNGSPLIAHDAATKYNADIVLIGKIMRVAGEWQAKWSILGTSATTWDTKGHTIDALYSQLMYTLRGHLINSYIMENKENSKSIDVVKIKIDGVDSIERYAKILEYLRGLTVVKLVKVMDVTNNNATFELNVNGGVEVIKRAINLDNFLEHTLTLDKNIEANELNYKVRL